MRRHRLRDLAGLLLVCTALGACNLQESIAQRPDVAGSNPTLAPAITGTTIADTSFAWASVRDRVVVLDFWASWCGPCRAEQADINHLYSRYAPRGVVFLGIDMRDDDASAQAYRRDLGVAYQSVADSTEQISAQYDVSAPPTVIVIDQRGRIVGRYLGTIVGVSDTLNRLL